MTPQLAPQQHFMLEAEKGLLISLKHLTEDGWEVVFFEGETSRDRGLIGFVKVDSGTSFVDLGEDFLYTVCLLTTAEVTFTKNIVFLGKTDDFLLENHPDFHNFYELNFCTPLPPIVFGENLPKLFVYRKATNLSPNVWNYKKSHLTWFIDNLLYLTFKKTAFDGFKRLNRGTNRESLVARLAKMAYLSSLKG